MTGLVFGAMLLEGLVGITALVAAACLHPGDYYAIDVATEKFAAMGLSMVNLQTFEAEIGEAVAGRPGGAVSLAVGMAQIFAALPGMKGLLGYWYHFAIMFEALFILTIIDTGTRVARFSAGWLSATGKFLPMGTVQGYLNAGLIFAMMACVGIVLVESGLRWWRVATGKAEVPVGVE